MQYPEKESAILEFKQELPNKQQIIKTIVAFCNLFGGKLIIGIDDNRNIIGVPEQDIDALILSLEQSIYQSCTPAILPSIYTQRSLDKLLLIIEVSQGMSKPYFVRSQGLNEGTFIRIGASTMLANASMIQTLAWQSKGFASDEIPVHYAPESSLNQKKIKQFLQQKKIPSSMNNIEKILLSYHLMMEEHNQRYMSIGGILLFAQEPQRFFPEAFIICSHFRGISGREVIATRDCTGTLTEQLEHALAFIFERLNKQFTIKNTKREERLEIPEIALREIVINAIAHRDYHLPGPIKIAIYNDRVEVFSPGNFPGPLNSEALDSGITYIRNHVICRILRELGYIEKLGSGFITVFKSYQEYHLATPHIIEGTGFIKCILPRVGAAITENNTSDEERILSLFYKTESININMVMQMFNISRQTAARRLKKLISDDKLQRTGQGPSVKYKLLKN